MIVFQCLDNGVFGHLGPLVTRNVVGGCKNAPGLVTIRRLSTMGLDVRASQWRQKLVPKYALKWMGNGHRGRLGLLAALIVSSFVVETVPIPNLLMGEDIVKEKT